MKFKKESAKYLERMPMKYARKLRLALGRIEMGDTLGLDIKPMTNKSGYYRLRIGDYRAIYHLADELFVEVIGARGDVYK
jgi:mRNA interferase RelE/StbE